MKNFTLIMTLFAAIIVSNKSIASVTFNYSALRMQAKFVHVNNKRNTDEFKKQYFKTIKEILGTDIKAKNYLKNYRSIKFISGIEKTNQNFWYQYASKGKVVKIEFFPSHKKYVHAFKINSKKYTYNMKTETLPTLFKKIINSHKSAKVSFSPISNAYADFDFSWDDLITAISSISLPSIKGLPMTGSNSDLGGEFCCELVDEAVEIFDQIRKDSVRCLADLTQLISADGKANRKKVLTSATTFKEDDTVLSYIFGSAIDSADQDFLDEIHDSNSKFTPLQAYQSVDKNILQTCETNQAIYDPFNDDPEEIVNDKGCSEKYNKHNNIMASLNFYMVSLRDCLKITQNQDKILNDDKYRNGLATKAVKDINSSSLKYAGKYEALAKSKDNIEIPSKAKKED